MRLALDTNILAYAEGVSGAPRKKTALDLIARLPEDTTFLPVQVLGELFHVLVRKAGRTPERAEAAVLSWHDAFPTIETSSTVMLAAMGLAARHKVSIWDAVVVAGAAMAGCRLLLSEDLHSGFTWSGLTVTNPFAGQKHELLEGLIG